MVGAHDFLEKLRQTRGRLRRLVWWHGAYWLAAGVGALVILACLTDFMLHVSSGMRLVFLLLMAAAGGFLAHRRLVRPLSVPVRDLDLTQRLERFHPDLGERLSNTVAFLHLADDDPYAGSSELRKRVMADAVKAANQLDFSQALDDRATRRAGMLAALVAVVGFIFLAVSPSSAGIALARLARPFNGPDWPQRTRVTLVDPPTKVAKGDPFQIEAVVEGVIPASVQLVVRFQDGTESAPAAMALNKEGRFKGGFEPVTAPFSYAVVAGDAIVAWRSVEVVPAPEIVSIRLAAQYPAYTRLAAETFPEGRGHVRAVVGSKVTIAARANKPLAAAELAWSKAGSTPATVMDDRQRLTGGFVVTQDDDYRLIVVDAEGMGNARRTPKVYRVQAIPDLKPEVVIEQPPGDVDMTATGTLPLRILAKDDFGVGKIELKYKVDSTAASPASREAAPDDKEKGWLSVPLFSSTVGEPRKVVDHAWALAPLKLSPGAIVRIRAEAADLRDSPGPNVEQSREVRVRIVGKEDFLRQFENEQQLLREELARVLKLQESTRTQTRELEAQARVAGALKNQDLENLQSAELQQRRVREKVAESDQSLRRQVDRMLGGLKNNNLADLDTARRLRMVDSELARLAEQHLPPISQALTQARKELAGDPDRATPRGEKTDNSASGKTSQSPDAAEKSADAKTSKPSGAASKDTSDTGADAKGSRGSDGVGKDAGGKDAADKGAEAKGADSKGASTAKSIAKADSKAAGKSTGAADSRAPERDEKSGGDAKPGEEKPDESNSTAGSTSDAKGGAKSDDSRAAKPGKDATAGKPSDNAAKDAGKSEQKPDEKTPKPAPDTPSVADGLARAEEHQKAVVDSLSQMLDQLDKWETVAQVTNDARDLAKRQAEIGRQLEKTAKETLGKKEADLTPEEKGAIAKSAEAQAANREQLQRLERKLGRLAEKAGAEDPLAAEAMKDAAKVAREKNIGGKMSEAERTIRQNKVADAAGQQKDIEKSLEDLVASLESRRDRELARLVKVLKEAETEAQQLAQEQKRLLQKTREAEKEPDPAKRAEELRRLQQRQRELKQKTEDLARRLSKLQAEMASRGAGRAAGRMDQAGRQLQGGQGEQAGEKQDEALEELAQAQKEIEKARKQAERELEDEQVARVAEGLKQLYDREIGVKEEIVRLDGQRKSRGNLTRGELQSLAALAKTQNALAGETAGLTEKISAAKVFAMVLEQAAEKMRSASAKMGQRDTGEAPQALVASAARELERLLDSLKPDKPEGKPKEKQEGEQGEGGEGQGGGRDGIPNVAQIKLLKLLQIELNGESESLALRIEKEGKPSPTDREALQRLSQRQGKLADMIRDIVEPTEENDSEKGDAP